VRLPRGDVSPSPWLSASLRLGTPRVVPRVVRLASFLVQLAPFPALQAPLVPHVSILFRGVPPFASAPAVKTRASLPLPAVRVCARAALQLDRALDLLRHLLRHLLRLRLRLDLHGFSHPVRSIDRSIASRPLRSTCRALPRDREFDRSRSRSTRNFHLSRLVVLAGVLARGE